MLILDVGKLKYNKKFYKAIIYTTLVLNILSYGVFPKSQSKYREELKESDRIKYAVNLYTEKKPDEVTTEVTLDISNTIKLIEDDYRYVADNQNAFFEYSIPSEGHKLNFDGINKKISFSYTTVLNSNNKGTCNVVKQVSENEKGIIWCNASNANAFNGYGIKLSMKTITDTYVNESPTKIETVTVTIQASDKSYSDTDYENIVVKGKDPMRVVLNNLGDCTTFNNWLEEYDAYYAKNALKSYNRDTNQNKTESFSEIEALKKYVATYVDSNSCNLENLEIPGISKVEEVTDTTGVLKRYIYKAEDNFVGYAKTKTQDSNSKEMYFTTSDGRSFLTESDNTKWKSIFTKYLETYYLNENPKEIADYVDILSVLQQVDDTNLPNGVLHNFKEGKVTLEPALLDYIYNTKYKAKGKVRTTIIGNDSSLDFSEFFELKEKMYDSFKEGLNVVYKDYFSIATLASLQGILNNDANSAKIEQIREFIQTEDSTETGMYIDGLRDYQVLGNDNLWHYYNSRTFTVYIRRDANYVWFEVLPLGLKETNTTSYTFSRKILIEGQNKNTEYLRRIQQLDAYYSSKDKYTYKHTDINDSIIYRYDENHNLLGYIQIDCIYNNGILDDVEYRVYDGNNFDQSIYPETASSNNIVVQDIDTSTTVDKEMNYSIEEKEEEIPTVEVKDEETVTIESASADSNLSGGDKEGNKEQLNVVQEDGGLTDKTDTDDKNSDIPLDDSDATSINPATNSSGSSVQQAGAETVPSPSTNNSIESINEIQIEIPPISTQ